MQNQRKGLLYQSSFDCFRKTVTKEGVSSLFKGMSAPLAFNIPASSLWFLGREHGLLIQQRLFNKRDHEMRYLILACCRTTRFNIIMGALDVSRVS